MALFKRGKVWWMDYTVEGERVRKSTETESRRDALAIHDTAKQQCINEKKLGIKPDRLFVEAVNLFLADKANRRSVGCYEQQLGWWVGQFGDLPLRKVTQERIIKAIERKRAEGCSNGTANRYLAALRGALRLVQVKHRWIDSAPKVFFYDEPKGRVRWLAPSEIARLLAALPAHLRGMARLSLATGLRQSNVKGLRWDQVDLVRRVLNFDGSVMKNGRDFSLPLSDEAVAVIRENLGQHATFVFTYQGRPITQIAHATWKRALSRAGIEDFRWHDMRHTWATMLAQGGVPTDAIQALGAWESPAMVQRYAHHNAESLRPHTRHVDGAFGAVTSRLRHSEEQSDLRLVA